MRILRICILNLQLAFVFSFPSALATEPQQLVEAAILNIQCNGLLSHAFLGGVLASRMANWAGTFFPARTNRQFVVLASLQQAYPSLVPFTPFLSNFTLERDSILGGRFEFVGRWHSSPSDSFLFSLTSPPGKPARLAFFHYFPSFGMTSLSIDDYIRFVERWIQAESKTQRPGSRGDVDFIEYQFSGVLGTNSDVTMMRRRSIYGSHSVSVQFESPQVVDVIQSLRSLILFLVQNSDLPVSSSMLSSLK